MASQLGTFALVPQVVRAVKVPVIAAGGIADAEARRRRSDGAWRSRRSSARRICFAPKRARARCIALF